MAEKLITKSFERLFDKGKHRGFITYEELGKSLGKRNSTHENIERAFLVLVDEKFTLVEKKSQFQSNKKKDTTSTTEEKSSDKSDDPIRMYLREMGGVELLSREGEIAIAKRIEAGKDVMINALTQSPLVAKKIAEWKEKIETTLKGLGFNDNDFEKKVQKLSGGWKMRLELAKILINNPDILLLDEPTNHLDMDSKDTLEEVLKGYEGSLITVSHDRWFLDQVVNRIWELQDGVVTVYYGNYTDYIRAKKGLPPLADGEISDI